MVPNPIYGRDDEETGPVYDSIRPQYEILAAVSPTAASGVVESTDDKSDPNTVRYVQQPTLPPSLQLRSQSFVDTTYDANGVVVPRSHSVSIPPNAPRAASIKKNGQERNKLGLTLTLNGGGVPAIAEGMVSESSRESTTHTDTVVGEADEIYIVMSATTNTNN